MARAESDQYDDVNVFQVLGPIVLAGVTVSGAVVGYAAIRQWLEGKPLLPPVKAADPNKGENNNQKKEVVEAGFSTEDMLAFGKQYYPEYMVPVLKYALKAAAKYGNDPLLMMEIVRAEYVVDQQLSSQLAVGPFQVMPYESNAKCLGQDLVWRYCFKTCPAGVDNGNDIHDVSCRPTMEKLGYNALTEKGRMEFNADYANWLFAFYRDVVYKGDSRSAVRSYGPTGIPDSDYTTPIMNNFALAQAAYEEWKYSGGMAAEIPIENDAAQQPTQVVAEFEPTVSPEQKQTTIEDACSKYDQVCEIKDNSIIFYKGWPRDVAAGVCASIFGKEKKYLKGCTVALEGIESMEFFMDPEKGGAIVKVNVEGQVFYGAVEYFLDCYNSELNQQSREQQETTVRVVRSRQIKRGGENNRIEMVKFKNYQQPVVTRKYL